LPRCWAGPVIQKNSCLAAADLLMLSVLKNDAREVAHSAAVEVTVTYKGSCRLDGAVAVVGYCSYSCS
jgi:hypothetical protein